MEDGAEAMDDDDARGLQGLKALADNRLDAVIEAAGGFAEARGLFARALQIFQSLLGNDHPRTLMARGNLEAASDSSPATENK